MVVTIVGNGNMAKGIAARILAGGNSVVLHVRDKQKGESLKEQLVSKGAKAADVAVVGIDSPVTSEVFIPAVHYGPDLESVAKIYAGQMAGKIVVDISNPVDFNTFQLITRPGDAGAEAVARLFPQSRVVKAFNTVFAMTLVDGVAGGLPIDVFIAGDDEEAKKTVAGLIEDGGMRPLDVGPLANARHLEGFGLIHMKLQDQVKGNWASGLKIAT